MVRWLMALVVVGASSAASAAEVIDSAFEVHFNRDGQQFGSVDTIVPYLPDNACYYWFVRFDPATRGEVTLLETFRLPEPLDAWRNYANDPASATQIAADAQGAVTTVTAAPDADGWVYHGWCVAEGDPLGPHTMSVSFEGKDVAGWQFTVVAAEDYNFDAPKAAPGVSPDSSGPQAVPSPPAPPPPPVLPQQPSPLARDVNRSW